MKVFSGDVDMKVTGPFGGAAAYRAEDSFYRSYGKYILDAFLILLSLPILLPVFTLFTIFAALDGSNPFFLQDRVGVDGKRFKCFKFRTMVPDAETRLEKMLETDDEAKREWDEYQKLRKDPRITPFGRILRKTSLDELPQLLNVLRGEMSIVGPRPFMPSQDALYRAAGGSAYYHMRPGITGAWQVSSRNDASFVGRVEYDNSYYKTLTLGRDLRILYKTVAVVLKQTGH